LVAARLALGDQALDHRDRHEEGQGEQRDDGRLGGGGEFHGISSVARGEDAGTIWRTRGA